MHCVQKIFRACIRHKYSLQNYYSYSPIVLSTILGNSEKTVIVFSLLCIVYFCIKLHSARKQDQKFVGEFFNDGI